MGQLVSMLVSMSALPRMLLSDILTLRTMALIMPAAAVPRLKAVGATSLALRVSGVSVSMLKPYPNGTSEISTAAA